MRSAFGDRWPLTLAVAVVVAGTLAVVALAVSGGEAPSDAPTTAGATAGPTAQAGCHPHVDPDLHAERHADLRAAHPPPTPDEGELALQSLRESAGWVNLAEWDRALTGRRDFDWPNAEGSVADFSNVEEVWDQVFPPLREELLLMARDEGIRPEPVRFRGSPIENANLLSGVIRWHANEGSGGRGLMFVAVAAYATAEDEPRYRAWPVLIEVGDDPSVDASATYLRTGPVFDEPASALPQSIAELDVHMDLFWRDWLLSQPVIGPAVDPPCPEGGCGR